jgi:hypothetical protein
MIVSGIPQENGMRHVEEMASIALSLINTVKRTAVAHMPTT